MSEGRAERVDRLWRARPRSRLLRASLSLWGVLGGLSLVLLSSDLVALASPRRLQNLGRFLGEEASPRVLRAEGGTVGDLLEWIGEVLAMGGGEALLQTLVIALSAMGLAALWGGLLALGGARELHASEPFGEEDSRPAASFRPALVRLAAIGIRALPEYILAFVLLALLGASAWPAVLALALHNAGILGRLGAEAIEDLDRRPLRALVQGGAASGPLAVVGVLPLVRGRYLLYVLYRLETCIREATVLGLLGIASLGSLVEEARARQRYDDLLLLVLFAGLLVASVESGSRWARERLRSRP